MYTYYSKCGKKINFYDIVVHKYLHLYSACQAFVPPINENKNDINKLQFLQHGIRCSLYKKFSNMTKQKSEDRGCGSLMDSKAN